MPQIVRPEKRANDIRALLEKHKGQIALALPKHLTADRLVRVALTAIQRTPKLLEADQVSLFAAIIQSAQLGLQPDGALGEAWLIPYHNRKRGVIEVQFQPGYRGLLSLVRRSGEISTVECRAVYAKDQFSYQYGLDGYCKHIPYDPGAAGDPARYDDEDAYTAAVDPGPFIAAYAIVRMKHNADPQWDVMRRHEIERVRRRSKSADDGPWVTDYAEMAKKTVLKRLCKLLPMSVEASTAIDLDDKAEVGIPQDLEIPPGVQAEEPANGGTALEQLTATISKGPAGGARGEADARERDAGTPQSTGTSPDAPMPDALPLEDATPPASEIPWSGSELPPEKPTKGRK